MYQTVTIYPGQHDGLKQAQQHHRDTGHIPVHYLQNINTTLKHKTQYHKIRTFQVYDSSHLCHMITNKTVYPPVNERSSPTSRRFCISHDVTLRRTVYPHDLQFRGRL